MALQASDNNKPQISLKLYCKWLTDRYNKLKTKFYNANSIIKSKDKEIENLKKQIDFINSHNKVVNNKYLNEKQEFQKELYKEDVIKSYQGKIKAQEHQIKCLREANNKLISENLKFQKEVYKQEYQIQYLKETNNKVISENLKLKNE